MMEPPLTQMQQRLEKHFDELSKARDTLRYPVFALEHGLNETERKHLLSMLASNEHPLSSRYWLLWVIYATEIGYGYAGDEYWSSFEEKTSRWEYHDRPKVKAWFRKFQKTYGGFTPSGTWAEHFSIIAWPITHAILPLYLQRQFAKLLYDLRFQLASSSAFHAHSFAIHASHAPTRFRAFLEQEQLTRQIVAALLGGDGGEFAEEKLIHPPTLRRIIDDLEKVRAARDWLRETRRVVSDRFIGIGRGAGPTGIRPSSGPRDLPDTSHLVIRPRLLLRHAGVDTWSVFLKVKSFRPVAALSAEINSFLNSTRCRLNGAGDFKPTGWLLSGDRMGALQSWPDHNLPLIRFEQPNPKMDHLLESECHLHPGPIWLFRIGADGIAHHIAECIVRPNGDYIIVTKAFTSDALEGIPPCNLDCLGVKAYQLAVPSLVSEEVTAGLKKMGLHVARTIRVWPAGLPGRGWDGEGSSEWLATESPCFGIACDHPVESFSFHLNDKPETLIRAEGTDQPLFVRLPPLPTGTHKLIVKAKRSPELESVALTPAAEGFVELAVRDPEPWVPGLISHPGLIVRADPDHADLDTFWRNKLELSVNGPKGFAAAIHVTLQSANNRKILSEQIGDMDLPITPDAWREKFDFFLNRKSRAWKYLEAAIGTLTIRADSLGTCTLQFEHQPLPVRWVIHIRSNRVVARLIDDSGQDETKPDISLYTMERPLQRVPPPTLDAARSGYVVAPPGVMLIAKHGQHQDIALISVPAQQSFQGLGINHSFPDLQRSARQLSTYFGLLRLWRDARLFGFLATLRHDQLMDSAIDALRTVLCGENWAEAEKAFKNSGSDTSLESLAAWVDRRTDFSTVLRNWSETDDTVLHKPDWFVDEAARNNVCRDRSLSRFALHLASEPLVVVDHPDLESLLEKLIDNPAILRAARLLTLLLNSTSGDTLDTTQPGRFST